MKMKKMKLKLTALSTADLNQIKGGQEARSNVACAGCLCDADVSGQVTTNNNKATSSAN